MRQVDMSWSEAAQFCFDHNIEPTSGWLLAYMAALRAVSGMPDGEEKRLQQAQLMELGNVRGIATIEED